MANEVRQEQEDEDVIELPAVASFSVRKHFDDNGHSIRGRTVEGVKFAHIWNRFRGAFIFRENRFDVSVPAVKIKIYQVNRDINCSELLEALGGEEKAELSLCHLWELLKMQGHGEEGNLLVNGRRNYFFIRDNRGKLQLVFCDWEDKVGWHLEAGEQYLPTSGTYVFSR